MKPLELHDQHHLAAAEGWFELGNHLEANEELENITPENRAHPAVLEVRWQIYAKAKQWDAALDMASTLIRLVPEYPLGWVHRSYSLHEMKRTDEARDNLVRVVDKFPQDPIMRYNLACYECQLGRSEPAKKWLEQAFEVGDSKQIKLMALEDPDLEPLWREIGEIPVVATVYENWFREDPFYRVDTRSMYLQTLPEIVRRLAEEITADKGVKLLPYQGRLPVLGELGKNPPSIKPRE